MNDLVNVLYVDDEINNLNSFKATYRRDFKVYTANSGPEALKIIKEVNFQVIITDQRMPEMTGVEFLIEVLKISPDAIRILLTGYSDINAVIDAVNKGQIYYYVNKPWDEQQLRIIINNAYEIYALREKNKILMEKLMISNDQMEFLLRQKLLS
ncbi:MAG: response regulator [Chitinophagaceae bacterium]|jgi:response regulator RpfG family c-di-GMP phosphodiesterase|nr:response regulator [Chitinophagaceae bacterium]